MSDVKIERAVAVYNTLCAAIDERGWNYERVDDDLLVHFSVNGDDLPVQFIIFVDMDRQLIRLLSPMPFEMDESKRIDGAIATCHATYGLTDGSFDYDLSDGKISYRLTTAYHDTEIGIGLIQYMIDFAGVVIDKYNDKFFALNKGYMSIEDFLQQ